MFSVLGDETRLSIVYFLKNGDANVTQIANGLGISQSLVSHQLKIFTIILLVAGTLYITVRAVEKGYTHCNSTYVEIFIIDHTNGFKNVFCIKHVTPLS